MSFGFLLVVFHSLVWSIGAFLGASPLSRWSIFPVPFAYRSSNQRVQQQQQRRRSCALLWMSGYGKATNYNWTEEAFEMEITVGPLPRSARAKDIQFKATPTAIDLQYQHPEEKNSTTLPPPPLIFLDGNRKLRGRIHVDGTFWAFSDSNEDPSCRYITVTVEKNVRHGKDDFDIVEYDWKGVYPKDEEEVKDRHYDKPEQLNVREYAASLGVDIDNINMSMVDKTMFTSGLNLTQSSLDQLSKVGLVNEVTVQADGSEYMTNPKTGESQPFSQLGLDNNGIDGLVESSPPPKAKIPFLDTDSPWCKTVPVEDIEEQLKNKTLFATAETEPNEDEDTPLSDKSLASDPIGGLTVKRLKEILKSQGLGVVGNKKDLQERLREHVKALLLKDKTERN